MFISDEYDGLWMEHAYDAVLYASIDQSKAYLAKNTIEIFIDHQREDGQYPFRVIKENDVARYEYTQIQECVSFLTLASEVAEVVGDKNFDKKIYDSGVKWISWLENNRMSRNTGLIEMFVGYDTGHDNSGR